MANNARIEIERSVTLNRNGATGESYDNFVVSDNEESVRSGLERLEADAILKMSNQEIVEKAFEVARDIMEFSKENAEGVYIFDEFVTWAELSPDGPKM